MRNHRPDISDEVYRALRDYADARWPSRDTHYVPTPNQIKGSYYVVEDALEGLWNMWMRIDDLATIVEIPFTVFKRFAYYYLLHVHRIRMRGHLWWPTELDLVCGKRRMGYEIDTRGLRC